MLIINDEKSILTQRSLSAYRVPPEGLLELTVEEDLQVETFCFNSLVTEYYSQSCFTFSLVYIRYLFISTY